jgi:hypothetical protein
MNGPHGHAKMGLDYRSITAVFPARGGGSTGLKAVRLSTGQQNKTNLRIFAPNKRLELTECRTVNFGQVIFE